MELSRRTVGLLLLLTTLVVGAEPKLSVAGNTYEGSALFVRVLDYDGEAAPVAHWEHRELALTRAGGAWETVIPLSIDSGGKRRLQVRIPDGPSWTRSFLVKKRNYGHQSITLNSATLASYDDPQNKADDEAIIEALENDTEARLFDSDFLLPVEAPQTTGFGLRRTYNGWKKGWHKGLDLAGWEGSAVRAPADGVVIHTARGIVNGNTLVLSHGAGVGSSYLHLLKILVEPGERVTKGQKVALVGGTGGFAPHLHWEVRVHGEPVHPKVFFSLPSSWK